jgi:hypothetical protein
VQVHRRDFFASTAALAAGGIVAGLAVAGLVTATAAEPPRRRVDVHLYGADGSPGAPHAAWYRDIGITDVWIYPVAGAFPQDQLPETQKAPADLVREGTLAAYERHGIRSWWFERPVPDFLYRVGRQPAPGVDPAAPLTRHIWDSSPETDALWQGVCDRIAEVYPAVRDAGFAGVVYDGEAYYNGAGSAPAAGSAPSPWLWGHDEEAGSEGNYYRRGLQIGRAIYAAWPEARVILVYAFGYACERSWYQGIHDAGVKVLIGPEHTYGAGPGDLGKAWFQQWWDGKPTKQVCDSKRSEFPFVRDNRQVLAGLFPINFGTGKPNYRARDFEKQLASAANDDAEPIGVWLWPEGPFTPQRWREIEYAEGDSAEAYLAALRSYSTAHGAR